MQTADNLQRISFVCGNLESVSTIFPITLDNKFKKKNFFVSVMNMLLIYLSASVKLEKGHKKYNLALVLKLCYTMIFYEIFK